jgi:hypothetical protein
MLDPSSYTLSNNGSSQNLSSNNASAGTLSPRSGGGGGRYVVDDSRWHFKDEKDLPKPRPFQGGPRRYRAGRGSSVPLDLSAL